MALAERSDRVFEFSLVSLEEPSETTNQTYAGLVRGQDRIFSVGGKGCVCVRPSSLSYSFFRNFLAIAKSSLAPI